MLIIGSQLIPLEPRGLSLCYSPLQLIFSGAHDCLRQLSPKTVNKKSVSAESASLKIAFTTLKVINLSPLRFAFKQYDFLRFVPAIFLTLISQGGNQGISLRSMCLNNNFRFGKYLQKTSINRKTFSINL